MLPQTGHVRSCSEPYPGSIILQSSSSSRNTSEQHCSYAFRSTTPKLPLPHKIQPAGGSTSPGVGAFCGLRGKKYQCLENIGYPGRGACAILLTVPRWYGGKWGFTRVRAQQYSCYMPGTASAFENTLARDDEGNVLIESTCKRCKDSRVVSVRDGSLNRWESTHTRAAGSATQP